MSLVITNGTNYVRLTSTGGVKKTTDINEAYNFKTVPKAIYIMNKTTENPGENVTTVLFPEEF